MIENKRYKLPVAERVTGMKCTVGKQTVIMQCLSMVTQTYCGDHFEMYKNTESLCCVK